MAELPADLFFATIPELNAKLKAREISAVALARAFSQRLETLGPVYNALALPLTKQGLHAAHAADSDIKIGRFRGPLQGIPFGAKDLLAYAGQPATWGARPYAAQVFDYTAAVLLKLEKAGAVLIGKLAMVELAGAGGYRMAGASLFGPGLNPWDRTRWSGGSSSGSASAVSAGLVPWAIGSETSGSIVTPAAFCGITALRPTYGLVSRQGAMPLSWTMDKLGPMCRSAEDCALALQSMAGGDKSFYYTPRYYRKMQDLRIGYSPADFAERPQASARPAFAQALQVWRDTGAKMIETKLPDLPYNILARTIIDAEAASAFETLILSGKVDQLADPHQIAGLKAAREITAADYLKAMRIRTVVQHEFRKLFIEVDMLLAPARLGPAPPISEPLDSPPESPPSKDTGLTDLIPAANLAGLPALAFPCGFADNLPVGLQLVGLPFSENLLIAAGREFQGRTDWHRRRPPGVTPG